MKYQEVESKGKHAKAHFPLKKLAHSQNFLSFLINKVLSKKILLIFLLSSLYLLSTYVQNTPVSINSCSDNKTCSNSMNSQTDTSQNPTEETQENSQELENPKEANSTSQDSLDSKTPLNLHCSDIESPDTPITKSKEFLRTIKKWKDFTASESNSSFSCFNFFQDCEYVLGSTNENSEIWKTSPKKFIRVISEKCILYASSNSQKFFLCGQRGGSIKYVYDFPELKIDDLVWEKDLEILEMLIDFDDSYVVFRYSRDRKGGIAYKRIGDDQEVERLDAKGEITRFYLNGTINYQDEDGNHSLQYRNY